MDCVGNSPRKLQWSDTSRICESVKGGIEYAAFPIYQLALYGYGDAVRVSVVQTFYFSAVKITGVDDLRYRIQLDDIPVSHVSVNPCDRL